MENILLAIDAIRPDKNALEFACYIARMSHASLTGIFLENMPVADVPVMKFAWGMPYVETVVAKDLPGIEQKIATCEENIALFKEACLKRGVNCSVRVSRATPVKEMIAESRFADIIIVSPETSFEPGFEGVPTHFVRDLLAGAECPVFVAPYSLYPPDEIVFAYDGSRSSAFAIRQFAHLFPELRDRQVTILQVDEKKPLPLEESQRLREWLGKHYFNTRFERLEGTAGDELFGYLLEKKNMFVVMGAYGRGVLSSLFRRSTADLLVKTVDLPVFISHC